MISTTGCSQGRLRCPRALAATFAALFALAGQAEAAPQWADLAGPAFSDGEAVAAAGETFVGVDPSRHSLRFSTLPNQSFSQWSTPVDDFGDQMEIADFSPTSSGAAWAQLAADDFEVQGFIRIGKEGTVLTPLTNACEDEESQGLVGVSTDERLWIACGARVLAISAAGTVAPVRCGVCAASDIAEAATAGGMWFVRGTRQSWELRLVDQSGGLVAARSFLGPSPHELVASGDRLYWLRPQAGGSKIPTVGVIESLSISSWQVGTPVSYRLGLSARVGRGKFPASPDYAGLVSPASDNSAWFKSDVFQRVVRVGPMGVTEFAVGVGNMASGEMLAAGGGLWARGLDRRLYRAALPGAVPPALPIVDQRPRIRLATRRAKAIALLSTVLQDSHSARPGTRVTVECLSKCRGRTAAATVRGPRTKVRSRIVLFDGARVRTESALDGFKSTTQLFEFTRARGNKVRLRILRIDDIPFKDLIGACGC